MRCPNRVTVARGLIASLIALAGALLAGCAGGRATGGGELALRGAIERYSTTRTDRLGAARRRPGPAWASARAPAQGAPGGAGPALAERRHADAEAAADYLALGMFPAPDGQAAGSQPAATRPGGVPSGYWRKDIWHQMGHEALYLGRRDFWRGFKSSFWDLENALALTATMGASVAIRETGVDDTIRARVSRHRQLGDLDETIQILGNPGTHFAATGVLWLTSALTRDVEQHELAKTLTQALAVNGVTTLVLKGAANTRAPDGEPYAWPSGHTSSAFTVAAVLNEHYGPWVGVPSLALAGLVGYQRVDSRAHDFSDVVFGAMLGYVVGTSIARDNEAAFPEIFGMKVVPFADPQTGATGIALMKQF